MFSVVIPTIGRDTLPRTLASIPDGVEVIVVADTHEMDVDTLANVRAYTGGKCLELDAGLHDRGDSQIAYGSLHASGLWLLNCGDDDVYEPGAFNIMSRAIAEQAGPEHPLMFKVELLPNNARDSREPVELWSRRHIDRFFVTGQSFVCPNEPTKLGVWDTDWRFMATTVALYGGMVDWREERTMRCY